MRRFLASLMSVVLAVGLMPTAAFAGQETGATVLTSALLAMQEAISDTSASSVIPDDDTGRSNQSVSGNYTAQSIGIGGHGAVFGPVIAPHDPKTILAFCDMGGLYVSHDEGLNWDIKNCGGRMWDIEADPNEAGTFYAGGSGLWRSTDNGDTWNLIWPDPDTVYATPTKLKATRTFYYSTDSYPNEEQVEAIVVDPTDKNHLVVTATDAPNYTSYNNRSLPRGVYESTDGGATFTLVATFSPVLGFIDGLAADNHAFIEPATGSGASRIVLSSPDGVFEVNRATGDVTFLYAPPAGERLIDCAQVRDNGGTHYVVLETANSDGDAALEKHTRIRLWHTTDFGDAQATVDLTGELVSSLPREYNTDYTLDENGLRTKGTASEITAHNALAICAPTMERIYLAYRTRDAIGASIPSFQGINGLVKYDATKPAGSQFSWVYGLRLWWKDPSIPTTPDQNMLMGRGHCDSSFTMLGMAADPNDPKRIVVSTHATLLFSPDIDYEKLYQQSTNRNYVNFYPRYARLVEPHPDYEGDPGMGRMRSTGLEVTVSFCLAQDPFDSDHLALGMDDASLAHSYDGGETWYSLYRNKPTGTVDTVGDFVFDEGRKDVAYASWHASGLFMHSPEKRFITDKGQILRSDDGGKTWKQFSTGLPETAAITDIEVVYPRDAAGNITDGERTIYVATMGYGFYVSRNSGVTFSPMNTGIPTVATSDVDCVWARHVIATDDGRIFGTTQYSSLGPANENGSTTYHSTQDARTFGNVWEWDASANAGAGSWVRLPFNTEGGVFDDKTKTYAGGVQLRQPSSIWYDEYTRTLYATGQCVQGPSYGGVITNFGGGLYAYTSATGAAVGSGTAWAVDSGNALLGNERNLSGIGRDALGRMWLAAEDGDVYVNSGQSMASGWEQVLDDAYRMVYGLRFGYNGNVYVTTSGIGALRIEPTGIADLKPAVMSLSRSSYAYDTTAHEPDVTVRFGSRLLTRGRDFAVSYANNTMPGMASVTVRGIGAYGGEHVLTFAIEGSLPAEDEVPGTDTSPGVDAPSSEGGEASGNGSTGESARTPEAVKVSLAQAVVMGVTDKTYTGKPLSQVPVVWLGSKALTPGHDYSVSYLNADKKAIGEKGVVGAGVYYAQVTGRGSYVGSPAVAQHAAVKFTVVKATQSISARKAVTKSYSGVRLGSQRVLGSTKTFSLKDLARVSAKTAVKYKKANSAGGERIVVNADTGRVYVKAGLAKGTYAVKVKLTAAKGVNYKAAKAKTLTLTVRVK